MAEPIIINNFQEGIGDSPHTGFGLMRNVDIEAFPGAAKAARATSALFTTDFSGTFTANASNDRCSVSGFNVPTTGQAVTVSSTGTLPAGLSAGTTYFVINIDSSTCQLATTVANADAGTQIDITDAGSGTHTMARLDPGTINHIIYDAQIDVRFYLDSNGRVWYGSESPLRLLFGNTLTAASGQGMATLTDSNATVSSRKTYLFVFRNAVIDVCDVSTEALREAGSGSWSNGWQNLEITSSNSRHAIRGQDNIVYYCNDQVIGSIAEASGQTFAPGTSSTYVFNDAALDFPKGTVASWLEELGTNLLIGDQKSENIYPWNRVDDSYNLPIKCPEKEIYRLKNLGNRVYVFAGTMGNIYITQGTYCEFFKKVPDYVVNNAGTIQNNVITWGGVDAVRNALLFGLNAITAANEGVFMLYPDGRLIIDNTPSTGATPVTAIQAQNNFYFIGYSGGADTISGSRYSGLEPTIETMFYRVATFTEQGAFHKLEVVTAKPATSGAQIRVRYRADTTSSFTTIATYTADGSAVNFQTDDIGLTDLRNVQFQILYDDDVELVEVRIIP